MTRFSLSCSCGAHWEGSDLPDAVGRMRIYWNAMHSDPGHEPCTKRQAGNIRRDKGNKLPAGGKVKGDGRQIY